MTSISTQLEPRDEPLLISEKEAARLLDCCEKTVARIRKDGLIKSVQVRGSIKYTRSEIERFISDQLSD